MKTRNNVKEHSYQIVQRKYGKEDCDDVLLNMCNSLVPKNMLLLIDWLIFGDW